KEEDIPAIIDELAKHVTKKRLKTTDAGRIIDIGRARGRYGDHPDATLLALGDLPINFDFDDPPWALEAAEELKAQNPTSDEAAEKIVDEFEGPYKAERAARVEAAWASAMSAESATAPVDMPDIPPGLDRGVETEPEAPQSPAESDDADDEAHVSPREERA